MAKTSRVIELEPIDRLEEKIRLLVQAVERLRADHTHALEENQRLALELDSARARLAESEGLGNEMRALREEREHIRSRVADMLQQIEGLNL